MAERQRQGWKAATQTAAMAFFMWSPFTWMKGAAKFFMWVGSSVVINAIFPSAKPQGEEASASYSWRHTANNTASHETPMPIVYGKARVKPVVKNRFITIEGEKEYLNVLYGFTGHRIDESDDIVTYDNFHAYYARDGIVVKGNPNYTNYEPGKSYRPLGNPTITPKAEINNFNADDWEAWHGTAAITDILINSNPLDNYVTGNSEDFSYETRPGLAEQSVIEGFDVTYANYPQDEPLYMNDVPEINQREANIRYDTVSSRVVWNKHPLLYRGESYIIQSDTEFVAPGETYYIYWDPTISVRKYYLQHNTPPTADTAHVIASIAVTATGLTPTYTISTPEITDWFSPALPITTAHNIEFILNFPYGLSGTSIIGDVMNSTARVFAQYRERGTDKWINFDFDLHKFFDSIKTYSDETTAGIITRAKQKELFISVKAKPEGEYLDTDKTYEVRASASSPVVVKLINIAGIVYGEENADGDFPGFTYPGESLLGIRVLASGKLAGDIEVTGVVERSTVKVYNSRTGGGWTDGTANTHAWAVYDILANGNPDHPEYPGIEADSDTIQPIYGCGVGKDNIDYESFRSWAEYTNRPSQQATPNWGAPYGLGYELNIVFDTITTAWDAILRICQEGRGIVYPYGSSFYAILDKRVASSDITQLFSMGNINLGTFSQQWVDKSKKANLIETTFWNEDNNYERTTFAIRTSDWDLGTDLNNPLKLALQGTTNYAQAFALATYVLNSNELLSHMVSFETDMEMLQSQVGDVIPVQHRAMIGDGGRVVGYVAGSNTVTLDKAVSISAGVTYDLVIQHSNDTIETKQYTGSSDTNTLVFGPANPWTTNPAQHDVWAFGVEGEATKLFRIIDINLAGDYKRVVVCMEYDPAIYQLDPYTSDTAADTAANEGAGKIAPGGDLTIWGAGKVAPNLNQPTLTTFNTAANLRLVEVLSRNRATGEYESSILVSWDAGVGENWGEWDVRVRDVDVSDLEWQGEWRAGNYSQYEKVEHEGYTYISMVDDNETEPFLQEA